MLDSDWGGHNLSCDAVLPLDWTAQTMLVPTNQWLLSNGSPLLYSAEKLCLK